MCANKTNPLSQMTLDQIDKVFAWHEGGKSTNFETWGRLGLKGAWADKPIHLYGWYESDVFSTFVERAALHDSHRWRCGMKQYAHIHRADGTIYDSGEQILDALANAPYGIALSNVRYLKDKAVKPLALARTAAGPYYAATKDTLIDRQYPLGRIIPAEIDRVPGQVDASNHDSREPACGVRVRQRARRGCVPAAAAVYDLTGFGGVRSGLNSRTKMHEVPLRACPRQASSGAARRRARAASKQGPPDARAVARHARLPELMAFERPRLATLPRALTSRAIARIHD